MTTIQTVSIKYLDRYQNIKIKPEPAFLKHLSINGVTRIDKSEFPQDISLGGIIYHFNLPLCDTDRGDTVVFAKIVEHGKRLEGWEKPPLLSFAATFLAMTISCEQSIGQEDIQPDWLKNSIGNIHDINSLRRTFFNRYGLVRGINREEIACSRVAVRQFLVFESFQEKLLDTL